jgi:Tfp pilus assembly protein PilO
MDNPNTSKPSSKYSVIALILFLFVMAGLLFYVKPSWDEVSSLALGRDDKATQKLDLQTKLTGLQKIQEQLNQETEVGKETSLAAIPERFEEDKLILDVSQIAEKNDIVLNSISFGIPVGAVSGEIARGTINASLIGTESGLIKFLKGIESNARKILVKSITVQLASSEAGVKLANFSVSMETYSQGGI